MRFETLYEHTLRTFVIEHTLPQDIFYYPNETADPFTQALLIRKNGVKPLLNELVKRHILTDMEDLNGVDGSHPRRVDDYVIVGDCLKPLHKVKENVPVEVVVYYNVRDFSEIMHARLDALLSKINGRYLPGTRRKIYYYVRHNPINLDNYLAVYHPFKNTWLKEPSDFNINL